MRTPSLVHSTVRVIDLGADAPKEIWRGPLLRYITQNDIDPESFQEMRFDLLRDGFHVDGAQMVEIVPVVRVVLAGCPYLLTPKQERDLVKEIRSVSMVSPGFKDMVSHGHTDRSAA